MNDMRRRFLERIRSNIANTGHHITMVTGGPTPRFAYSIGLYPKVGFEVVMAGACYFSPNGVKSIIDHAVAEASHRNGLDEGVIECGTSGMFTLRQVHASWSSKMLLGPLDYYDLTEVKSLQIVPGEDHWTIDVPDMTAKWGNDPIWRWLEDEWPYPVPKDSHAITHLDALRGQAITEVVRWEDDEWEMFAGPGSDVLESDARTVPLGTLIGADKSLEAVTQLGVGEGLWRDHAGDTWHVWQKSKT